MRSPIVYLTVGRQSMTDQYSIVSMFIEFAIGMICYCQTGIYSYIPS